MTRPLAQTPKQPLYEIVSLLWRRNERSDLKAVETDLVRAFLERWQQRRTSIGEAYTFTERQPPKGCRFDTWGKRWLPESDTFEWERFPNCFMDTKTDTTGLVIWGLPDHAKLYKILWWTTITLPPVIDDDNRTFVD